MNRQDAKDAKNAKEVGLSGQFLIVAWRPWRLGGSRLEFFALKHKRQRSLSTRNVLKVKLHQC
jgi:hypothetical protein